MKITSNAARKALGEAGFFEKNKRLIEDETRSQWERTTEDIIILSETVESVKGYWRYRDGKKYIGQVEVDFTQLGVRNENIQNNNSPDE